MKINTRAVKEAGEIVVSEVILSHQIDPNPPFGVAYPNPFNCEVKASIVDEQVLIRADLNGHALLTCSRCLEQFPYGLKANFEVIVGVEQGDIELSSEITQALVLVLPMKPLCQENCRGLCAHCGQNLNAKECPCKPEIVHPALEALKKLKFHPVK